MTASDTGGGDLLAVAGRPQVRRPRDRFRNPLGLSIAALVASFRDEHIDLVTEQVDFAKAVNERCREILDTR